MAQIRDGKFATLRVKVLWTALFFLCFMIGRYIPIPLLHGTVSGHGASTAQLLNATNVVTGANFFNPTFFSLGLGPWMGAAILWRFLFIGRLTRARKIPERTVERARNALMVVLAIIQAISLMSTYQIHDLNWGPFSGQLNSQILVVIILTAGAIVVAWLAKRNEDLGLGGITMFILYQIIISAMRNFESLSITTSDPQHVRVLWFVVAACVCVILLGIFAGNVELRLHVNKVSIDSGFTGVSYLPIKLNPAGASPLMYALALLSIPQYVVHAAAFVIPGADAGTSRFLALWGLSNPVGFTAYLLLLFGLTIFFGLFTVGARDVAKRMADTGQYFDYVPPGHATRWYIQQRVLFLSIVTGVFLVIFTGLPLYFIGTFPSLQFLLTAPQTLMILLALLWMLYEEIADTMIGTRYSFSFGTTSRKAVA